MEVVEYFSEFWVVWIRKTHAFDLGNVGRPHSHPERDLRMDWHPFQGGVENGPKVLNLVNTVKNTPTEPCFIDVEQFDDAIFVVKIKQT